MESLRSGIVEFDLRYGDEKVSVKRFVAFDNAQEKVRCDTENLLPEKEEVRVIHTKTEFLQFGSANCPESPTDPHTYAGSVSRLNPGETSKVENGNPIDISSVGFLSYGGLKNGGLSSGKRMLKDLEGSKPLTLAMEKDIALLVYDSSIPSYHRPERWAVWIDTANDYVPIRIEFQVIPLVDPRDPVVVQRFETLWGRVDDFVVPLQSTATYFDGTGGVRRVEKMRFDWKSVNKKVADELFTMEGLKLPVGTYIVDTRLGTPIVEKVVGLDKDLPEASPPRRTSWMTMAIIAGTVLLLVVIATVVVRRRMQ